MSLLQIFLLCCVTALLVLAVVLLWNRRSLRHALRTRDAELAASRRAEALTAGQMRVLEMIAADAPLHDTLTVLLETVEAQSPDMLCSIQFLDEHGTHVRHGAAPRLPPEFSQAIDGAPIGPQAGSCGTAVFRRERVFVADIATDPLWEAYRHLALPFGLRACWSTPIFDPHGRPLGTFAIYYRQPGLPREEHLRLIEAASHTATICINRHRTEEALKQSEERFRQVVENIEEVFWITNTAKTQILYLSPAYEKIWQRSCASVYADPSAWLDAVHPDDRERVSTHARTKQAQGEYAEEYRIVRPDGSVRWISDRAFPIRDAEGKLYRVAGVAGVAEDITARRELEEQFRQSQKMEAIGALAGGIAHDFNNLLSAINGNAELALHDVGAEHPAQQSIREILKAGSRAKNLVQQILTFTREQQPQRIELALGAGSVFDIYSPAASGTVAELPAAQPPTLPQGGGQRLLYLDDEEALVILTMRIFERSGYTVSGFTNSVDALEAFRADPYRFDLAVTDFNMPGASGLDVAAELMKIRPDMSVVLTSGYVTDELRERAARAGIRKVIYKPNTVNELCEAVQQVLHEPRES